MEALVVIAILLIGCAVIVYAVFDEQSVDFEIHVEGEGTVDPSPGTYSIERYNDVTLEMTASDGWLLSNIIVNDEIIYFDEVSASCTVSIDGDTTVVVNFVPSDVPIPVSSEFTYDDSVIFAYTGNGLYTVTGGTGVNAGTYVATFSLVRPDVYRWSDGTVTDKTVTWTIAPKRITQDDFLSIPDVTYSGQRIMPVPSPVSPLTVYDLECTYGQNMDVGVGTVNVTASRNFTGEVTLEFNIVPKALNISVSDANTVYGSPAPNYDYTVEGFVSGQGIPYLNGALVLSCVYSIGMDAGQYPIVASGVSAQNYDITITNGTLYVASYQLKQSDFTIDQTPVMYDGTPRTKVVRIVPTFIDESTDISIGYDNNVDASNGNDATVTITGDGKNCVGTIVLDFEISRRDVTFTSASADKVYDGIALTDHVVSISGSGLVHEDLVSFIVTGSQTAVGESKNAFTYCFTQGNASNYDVTAVEGTLKVTADPVGILITADSSVRMYDGTPLVDDGYSFTGTLATGDVLEVIIDGTITDVGSVENVVSSYRVMRDGVDVTSSYQFQEPVNGRLEVTKRSVILTSGSSSKYYDGTPLTNGSVIVGGDGFAVGEGAVYDIDGSVTLAGTVSNIFTYELDEGTDPTNYDISVVFGSLQVMKVPTPLVIVSESSTKVYDGAPLVYDDYTRTPSVLIPGDVLTVDITGAVTDVSEGLVDNIFTFEIRDPSGTDVSGCYDVITVCGKLSVMPYVIDTGDFTVDLTDVTYDGTPRTKTISPNWQFLVIGETYSVSYVSNVDAGEASILVTGLSDNCVGTASYTFDILRKGVTVTTPSAEKVYDGYALTRTGGVIVTGVVDSDGYVLTVTGSIIDVGTVYNTFSITWSDATDACNYDVDGVLGTLKITPCLLTSDMFDSIPASIYLGGQIRPAVAFDESASFGLTVEEDCVITYGDNDRVGLDAGTVIVHGKGNCTTVVNGTEVPVVLYFDIYTGIKVYITEDGLGNTYSDWTLSDFGASPRLPLFDLTNIASNDSQTASMVVKGNPDYRGMYLAVSIKDMVGIPAIGDGSNELDRYLVLSVKRGDSVFQSSFDRLSQDMLLVGEIEDGDDIPVEVTISLSQDASGGYVQYQTLGFTLVIGVSYPSDDGGI